MSTHCLDAQLTCKRGFLSYLHKHVPGVSTTILFGRIVAGEESRKIFEISLGTGHKRLLGLASKSAQKDQLLIVKRPFSTIKEPEGSMALQLRKSASKCCAGPRERYWGYFISLEELYKKVFKSTMLRFKGEALGSETE